VIKTVRRVETLTIPGDKSVLKLAFHNNELVHRSEQELMMGRYGQ